MTTYLMDNPREGARVNQKTDHALTREQLRWAGLSAGQTVLDLGCAAGETCRIMAECVGKSGRVIGVDASEPRIRQAGQDSQLDHPIAYRVGEAKDLPVETDSVDLAWSRFLFEYLPYPPSALEEMIRVTRPGGTVCVSDLDGNCVWHDPVEPRLKEEIDEAVAAFGRGFDPYVGRKLWRWFVDAGLEDVAIDVRPYHLIAGRIASRDAELWRVKLQGVAEALEARGWASERASALASAFEAHLRDPRTFTYSTLITVRARVT
ncbi:methyltransferase domain-containing protein [Botrimarina sp.]|uniref:methyltransferase domain-containing protein n=1 Tax=Botrimarina sp. TaxID=2795802 RepID=UPI0032EEA3B3